MSIINRFCTAACLAVLVLPSSQASSMAPPGDLLLRHDLQLLHDERVIDISLTTWPVAWEELQEALGAVDLAAMDLAQQGRVVRLRQAADRALRTGWSDPAWQLGVAASPSRARWFQSRPRDSAEVSLGRSWQEDGWSLNLRATAVGNPDDGDKFRPDGAYLGKKIGNWLLTAGWQERWWGPGMGGSLILSSNSRPIPAVGLQRLQSDESASWWFKWAGPWTLTTFMGLLDDDRAVENALLFGVRATIRPHRSLEIGVSRTAQWCGNSRPCGASAFTDLLLGRDNRGVNVDPADEPGNQLGGIDLRWSLPGKLPVAVYLQWIGEDSRRGGPEIGSWLRQFGIEVYGGRSEITHRTHFEVSETTCRDGGLGFSAEQFDCGYEHGIYRSGYRYQGRSMGHGQDSDGLSYSLQTTLVQSSEQFWTVSVRHMQVNRGGSPTLPHGLSTSPEDIIDAELSVRRATTIGFITAGIGLRQIDHISADATDREITGLLQWSSF